MATYVNLNVNQGLINKAKQVQSANRNALTAKQQKVKTPRDQRDDSPRRRQALYTPRKRTSSDDQPFVIGRFRSDISCGAGERWPEELQVWSDNWPGTAEYGPPLFADNWSLNISFSRSFSSGDGASAIIDEFCSDATVRPFIGTNRRSLRNSTGRPSYGNNFMGNVFAWPNSSHGLSSYMKVFPVGGDVAIVAVQVEVDEVMRFNPGGALNPQQPSQGRTLGQFAFVVSETVIRRLPSIPNTVFSANGDYMPVGPSWAAWFNYRRVGPTFQSGGFRAPSPPPVIWVPDIYLNSTGLRGDIEPTTLIGWDTTDGELFDGSNPWLLHSFPVYGERNSREPITPEMEHPNPNYKIVPVPRWVRPEYPPGQNILTSGYHMDWQNIDAGPVIQNRVTPNFYSTETEFESSKPPNYPDLGPATFEFGAPQGDTQLQHHTFWDWNAPEYCRAEALAMGFTEDDLEP